jgi:hypothetical protein
MADEGSKVDDQVESLAKEITRISGGSGRVTFGELVRDERITQQFEALLGTLKAARKRNILDFQGELLLMGKHDKVMIGLVGSKEPQASEELEGNDVELDASMPITEISVNLAPPTHTIAAPVKEPSSVDPSLAGSEGTQVTDPVAEALAAADAVLASVSKPSTPASEAPVADVETHALADTVPASTANDVPEATADEVTTVESELPAAADEVASGQKKWNVDISYIDYRTADPNRREVRREVCRSTEAEAGSKDEYQSRCQKDQDGKWLKVDTSYIKHRTGDPNHIRSGENCTGTGQFADPCEKKYAYEQLKGGASRPSDVDPACKEQYLVDEEFSTVFQMGLADFYKLPKWKQQNMKKLKELF